MFSYQGYENAFNLVNEVKNPLKTLKWSAPASLITIGVLYMLANIAYVAAASKQEIVESEINVASLFFQKVFGGGGASRALNFLICVSAFGNLLVVLIGQSRMLRECGRYLHLKDCSLTNHLHGFIDKVSSRSRDSGPPLAPLELR
jgi:amino acid transporter